MPRTSKYIAAPFQITAKDTSVTNPSGDFFISKLREAVSASGWSSGTPGDSTDKGYYPADADISNPSSNNILDVTDFYFWYVNPLNINNSSNDLYNYTAFSTDSSTDNYFTPKWTRANYTQNANILNADLPSGVTFPEAFPNGSIELQNARTDVNDCGFTWVFTLKPLTTYTFSFYFKKTNVDFDVPILVGDNNGSATAFPTFTNAKNITQIGGVFGNVPFSMGGTLVSTGATYTYSISPDAGYPDTSLTKLTDGNTGSDTVYNDGTWVGWRNTNVVITMNLGSIKNVGRAEINYFVAESAGISAPSSILVEVGDGTTYTALGTNTTCYGGQSGAQYKHKTQISGTNLSGQYVRITLNKNTIAPGATDAWILLSEIGLYDLTGVTVQPAAAINSWVRRNIQFTTTANGIVWINLGNWSTWGQRAAASIGQRSLRFAYPQLEEGSTVTNFRPSKYWKYFPKPTPLTINQTIANGFAQANLLITLPGSVVNYRLLLNPDFVTTTGQTRADYYSPYSATADETNTTNYNTASYSGNQNISNVLLNMMNVYNISGVVGSGLGQVVYNFTGYSSSPTTIAFTAYGTWAKMNNYGGVFWSNTNALAGTGHNKFVSFKVIDLGSNNIRVKFTPIHGMYKSNADISEAFDLQWSYDTNILTDSTSVYVNRPFPGLVGCVSFNLSKTSDVFLDGIGNSQTLVLNAFQNNTYTNPLVVTDFTEQPLSGDDGSLGVGRWGFGVYQSQKGLGLSAGTRTYTSGVYNATGTFGLDGPISPQYNSGLLVQTTLQDVVLGSKNLNLKLIQQLFVGRSIAGGTNIYASMRGKAINLFFSNDGAWSGNNGDIWLSQDGTQYYCISKNTLGSASPIQSFVLFVKI